MKVPSFSRRVLFFCLFTNGSKMAEGEEEVMEEPWVPSNEDISNALSGLAKTEDGASVVYTKLALPGKQVFDVRVCAILNSVHSMTTHVQFIQWGIQYFAWYSAILHVLKRSVVRNSERDRETGRERETENTTFINGALGRS